MHHLLECKHHIHDRETIFNSIITELDYNAKKYNITPQDIIGQETYSKFTDVIATRSTATSTQSKHETLSLLMGGKINKNLPRHIKTPIKKMLIAHTILLIQIIQEGIPIPQTSNTNSFNNLGLYKEDLARGKIIVRARNTNNELEYINIRKWIDSLELPQLHQYNIGLGSASTRTEKQKQMAQQYTQTNKMIREAPTNIIFVDGSIHPRSNYLNKKGGFGGILINKKKNQITTQFYEKTKTNDPQEAELHGLYAAIQLASQQIQNKTTIFCDCKNAINYINGTYRVPNKYGKIYQAIKEVLVPTKQTIMLQWIPGHTNNKWNDKADELAKLATTLWQKPPGNRSLPRRHFRPDLITE